MIEKITRQAHQELSRAILKTLLYRIFMIFITFIVALIITGQMTQAVSIGIVTNLLKTGTYFIYERVWDRIYWGIQNIK